MTIRFVKINPVCCVRLLIVLPCIPVNLRKFVDIVEIKEVCEETLRDISVPDEMVEARI